jgi:hypothetical protein
MPCTKARCQCSRLGARQQCRGVQRVSWALNDERGEMDGFSMEFQWISMGFSRKMVISNPIEIPLKSDCQGKTVISMVFLWDFQNSWDNQI